MYFLYQILLSSLILISPIIIFIRILKKKEDKKRFLEKFGFSDTNKSGGKLIWFHGSSVGEIMSLLPLIHHYENIKTIKEILVTSNTTSSYKILQKLNLKKTIHQYYPIDHDFIVKKFLRRWKPSVAIFVDSEIWPSMFKFLNRYNINLIQLNTRITQKSFKRWMKLKNFSYSVFKNISASYPQNNETKYYLKNFKVKKIKSIGNIKFIENKLHNEKIEKLNHKFKKFKTWVAASTHQGEEQFCARAHIKLKKKIKNLITIIIPRHIHRVNEISKELNALKLNIVLHSSNVKNLKNTDIYIVDTFGESKKFYKLSPSVFLGKSIKFKGGQNPLEALHYGSQILHGPHVENFRDVYNYLKSVKASIEIRNLDQLVKKLTFKKDKFVENKIKKIGSTIFKKTINEIDQYI